MGREVRMVPEGYIHPKNGYHYVPLLYTKNDEIPNCDYMFDKIDSSFNKYCMYETCSEGTPLTPLFDTPEELAKYCANNGVSYFGNMTASYEQWMNIINGSSGGYLGIDINNDGTKTFFHA